MVDLCLTPNRLPLNMEMTAFTVFFLPFFECSYLRYFAGKKYVRPKSLVCTSQVRQRTSRTWDFTRVRQPRKHKRGHREHSKISFLVSTYSSLTYVFSFILPLHLAKTQTRLDFFCVLSAPATGKDRKRKPVK